MTPLRQLEPVTRAERRAARMVRSMRAPRELSDEGLDLSFRAAYARSHRARAQRTRRWALAFATTAAAAAVALFALRPARLPGAAAGGGSDAPDSLLAHRSNPPAGWHVLAIGDLGSVELSPEAAVPFALREEPAERQMHVAAGLLRAHIERQDPLRPVVVITPHLRIVVVGTRFDVAVGPELTRVEVLEGRVRVESPSAALFLSAGEVVSSDDPRLAAPPPLAPMQPPPAPASGAALAPPARRPRAASASAPAPESAPLQMPEALAPRAEPISARCGKLEPLAARKNCLEEVAAGEGLAAQSALFALGRMAAKVENRPQRALDYWRRYERRFPDGMFASEAALGVLEVLLAEGRLAEAQRAAEDFEQRFVDDTRALEVSLVRARLLCVQPSSRAEGFALLARIAGRAPSAMRGRLEQARLTCGGPGSSAGGGGAGAGAAGAGANLREPLPTSGPAPGTSPNPPGD